MKKKMKKKKYQQPEIEVIAVEPSHFFCVSGTIHGWSEENDESGDDDWSDDNSNNNSNNSSNNSKKLMWNNPWEK